ncbi:MAG: hypothetical protein ACLFN4_06670 [Candidatus Acetothermia bacterium]
MAELTVQEMDMSGLDPSFDGADSEGDKFRNDGKTFLYVKDTGTTAPDVTLKIQKTIDVGGVTLSITDPTVSVESGGEQLIGPFPLDWLNDADKFVNVEYDDETDVDVAAIKLA